MSSSDNIEVLKTQLYLAETKYSWEFKGSGLKHENLVNWLIPMFVGCTLFVFFWFVFDELTVDSIAFWGFLAFMTVMVLLSRYLLSPDKHRCYHLTALGIHYTEQDMIPEVAYQIVRGFAWGGIVVCIIAGIVLGPLAFVGAGAFALMAFGMSDFQPIIDKCCLLIDERTVVFNLMDDGVVSFATPEKGAHAYSGDIFTSLEQKEELLFHLRLIFPNIEVVKIKRLNDQYTHTVYQQDEEVVK